MPNLSLTVPNVKKLRGAAQELQQRETAAREAVAAVYSKALAEDRQTTDAEKAEIATAEASLANVRGLLSAKRDEIASAAEAVASEKNTASLYTASVEGVKASWENDPKRGFATHRDYLMAVMEATSTGIVDERLMGLRTDAKGRLLATAGSDEQSTFSDPHGGYLIPEAMIAGLRSVSPEADPTAGRVTQIPMAAPTVQINARVDKNHSTSVSGGLRVYRREEAAAGTSSRMELEKIRLSAHTLMGVNYESEELLSDSPISFAALIAAGFNDEFASAIANEKIRGTGVGQYTGVLNAPGTITVAKETSQTADTINATNVQKMRQRCWRYSDAVWITNHDCYISLTSMHIAGTNGDVFIFAPGNGVDRPDTLLGRPIFFSEYASTLGDKGDLILGVWSEYLEGVLQGVQGAESMHVRFLENERTFRFSMRNDGAPWWRSALTPKNGANTLSPFVTLAARA